ncbi:uncharacterized protein LOC143883447 isoform X2 [Tasmannia lanceolata]|uniref:uncharacterized protein LOC143883447 isoform X2 n=1 Tax=Tasmannia lanceolata TaxID=3420 RepID=UPI00406309D0
MQRQSLGSSSSKLQIHGGKDEKFEEEESEEKKAEKLVRSSFRTEKFVHLIPVLTIFCFLVLYLVSYDPSQNDPEYSRGHERFLHPKVLCSFTSRSRVFKRSRTVFPFKRLG